ncbi:hypothetical protein FHX76_001169 [Lysinibacter cavernae]|uniref:Uncharacterized protein n=1 Tax=Lysinibacter cavernae TaxID=1640652 RepID=A0A7X5TSA7_9MICO|nr:hypothetical protein [Lysinibacter cavernae]
MRATQTSIEGNAYTSRGVLALFAFRRTQTRAPERRSPMPAMGSRSSLTTTGQSADRHHAAPSTEH